MWLGSFVFGCGSAEPPVSSAPTGLTASAPALCQVCSVSIDGSALTASDTGGPVDPATVTRLALLAVDLPLADAVAAGTSGALAAEDIVAEKVLNDLDGTTAVVVEEVDWTPIGPTATVAVGLTTAGGVVVSRLVATAPGGVDALVLADP